MSYLSILTAIISFATQHPEVFARLWAAITDAYQASLDMIETFKGEHPDFPMPRESDDTISPEISAKEAELEGLIAKQGARAFGGGQLSKIIGWLRTNPTGHAWLQYLLGKIPLPPQE